MHAVAHFANAAYLTELHERRAQIAAWSPSPRRDALLDDMDLEIERMTDAQDALCELAEAIEESATVEVEVSAVLDRAMTAAHKAGCALVKGAARVGVELERHAPGCCVQRGPVRIWTVAADGGEYRLVVRDGSFNGAMHWRAR